MKTATPRACCSVSNYLAQANPLLSELLKAGHIKTAGHRPGWQRLHCRSLVAQRLPTVRQSREAAYKSATSAQQRRIGK